mmetsp:Transcript_18077/g.63514  ORF Transcript_18077/g.63514 Transcript_18077/m.63514 type:complete len:527 (+) Transcript_18077:82-1662(+)
MAASEEGRSLLSAMSGAEADEVEVLAALGEADGDHEASPSTSRSSRISCRAAPLAGVVLGALVVFFAATHFGGADVAGSQAGVREPSGASLLFSERKGAEDAKGNSGSDTKKADEDGKGNSASDAKRADEDAKGQSGSDAEKAVEDTKGKTVSDAKNADEAASAGEDERLTTVPKDCDGCKAMHPGIGMNTPRGGPESPIAVSWFGKTATKYFKNGDIVDGGKGVELKSNPEMGLNLYNSLDTASNGYADYTFIPLAGNRITVTIDLGNPGPSCGCNIAFFVVSMPSKQKNIWGGDYCDANCVGERCCAEFDLMELNIHSFQATSHPCSDYRTPPFTSQSYACSHGGDKWVKFGNGDRNYGPSDSFTINSQKPYVFRMEFPTVNGVLKAVLTLTQGYKVITATMDNIENMRAPLTDGMVLSLSSWYSEYGLDWLDGGVCPSPQECNRKSAIFESIVVEELPKPTTTTPNPHAPTTTYGAHACPVKGTCGCDWVAQYGCPVWDDATECYCRCCCSVTGSCKWNGNTR